MQENTEVRQNSRIRGIDDTLADSLHHLTELANLHEHGVERFRIDMPGFYLN